MVAILTHPSIVVFCDLPTMPPALFSLLVTVPLFPQFFMLPLLIIPHIPPAWSFPYIWAWLLQLLIVPFSMSPAKPPTFDMPDTLPYMVRESTAPPFIRPNSPTLWAELEILVFIL